MTKVMPFLCVKRSLSEKWDRFSDTFMIGDEIDVDSVRTQKGVHGEKKLPPLRWQRSSKEDDIIYLIKKTDFNNT